MLGNMDAHRREVRGIEDIIDICRPIFVADTRRPVATDIDIPKVRTMLESTFHQVYATGNNDRMQISIVFKSIEGDLVYLITKSIVRHLTRYLHDFLRIDGRANRDLTPTPRLKDHVGILKTRHHLEVRSRIDNAVPSPEATSEECHCQAQSRQDTDETCTAMQQNDDITDMTKTLVNGLEHLVYDTRHILPSLISCKMMPRL